jgi:hypothetical protein
MRLLYLSVRVFVLLCHILFTGIGGVITRQHLAQVSVEALLLDNTKVSHVLDALYHASALYAKSIEPTCLYLCLCLCV